MPWLSELYLAQGIEEIFYKDNTRSISLRRFLRMTQQIGMIMKASVEKIYK